MHSYIIIKPSVDIVNINQNSRTLGLGVLREKNNQIATCTFSLSL